MQFNSGLTWSELIELDGPDFVRACYREILQREPDESGFVHHVDALFQGVSKVAVVAAIASGDEACLSGRAMSPIAVRARDALFLESGEIPAWMRLPITSSAYRFWREARLRRRAADMRASAGPQPMPQPVGPPVEVSRIPASEWEKSVELVRQRHDAPALWFDLTTAFQWTGGVVGIVRAELEIACGLKRIHPALRFSMQVDQGFVEIDSSEIGWLLDADNVVDAYMKFFGRYPGLEGKGRSIRVSAPNRDGFFHPYKSGDSILAAGWMDSQKENYFARVKRSEPGIFLAYLIYDIIMLLEETRHFYPRDGRTRFEKYIEWASKHCDLLLYGGQTAQRDTEAYLKDRGLHVPPGVPVRFGTDIVKLSAGAVGRTLIENLGISGDFILTVGSIEPRKNHETLYRAYLMALEAERDLPVLVIVGKPMWRAGDLMNILTRHPELKDRVLCLRPTDLELAALYENCLFTVLPSLYEGWSLTLPESLGQGKFCICSDTPPLREIGGDLVDYVDPFDVRGWAEKLLLYSSDEELLAEKTQRVAEDWPTTHWVDTAEMARDAILMQKSKPCSLPCKAGGPAVEGRPDGQLEPTIWMDLTFSYLQWRGGVSGVVRAELELARHLKALRPETRFFAYQTYHDYFFEIDSTYLKWLFEADDLANAYKGFLDFWLPREERESGFRNPFFQAQKPVPGHPAFLPFFPPDSIVFFAGIDSDGTGTLHRSKDVHALIEPGTSTMTSQLIYDLTPLKCPQFHTEPTCVGFRAFFEHVSNHFDHLVYGGRTAMEDGISAQKELELRSPPSASIEFGSDILRSAPENSTKSSSKVEALLSLGISSDFLLSVGTIEPRKNHEVLYKAYLILLKSGLLKKPLQLVFVGKPGWNSGDFLATLQDDDRVRDRILLVTPTDEQLDLLYRNCLFTLLPSFYEGWSLTLPESLSYGKFCLASDVAPLREVGRDLVDYVNPLDTYAWADRIAHFANDRKDLARREKRIRERWEPPSWRDSAQRLSDELLEIHRAKTGHLFGRARGN